MHNHNNTLTTTSDLDSLVNNPSPQEITKLKRRWVRITLILVFSIWILAWPIANTLISTDRTSNLNKIPNGNQVILINTFSVIAKPKEVLNVLIVECPTGNLLSQGRLWNFTPHEIEPQNKLAQDSFGWGSDNKSNPLLEASNNYNKNPLQISYGSAEIEIPETDIPIFLNAYNRERDKKSSTIIFPILNSKGNRKNENSKSWNWPNFCGKNKSPKLNTATNSKYSINYLD